MLKIKCAYWLKLFFTCGLATTILSTIEASYDHPALFIATALPAIILIRLLWLSAQKDEARLKAHQIKIRQRAVPQDRHKINHAA